MSVPYLAVCDLTWAALMSNTACDDFTAMKLGLRELSQLVGTSEWTWQTTGDTR